MEISELLNRELIFCGLKAKDSEEAIRQIGQAMYERGLVKETFVEAVLEREREMPTGLPLDEVNAAIPHADIEHVIEPALGIATLNEPVLFRVMVDPDETVEVTLIFLLALSKPHDQIEMLQKVAIVLQDSDLLRDLKQVSSVTEVMEILSKGAPV